MATLFTSFKKTGSKLFYVHIKILIAETLLEKKIISVFKLLCNGNHI